MLEFSLSLSLSFSRFDKEGYWEGKKEEEELVKWRKIFDDYVKRDFSFSLFFSF